MNEKNNILDILQDKYDDKILLSSSDVAEILGVSQGTVTNMVKGNKLPYLKFGDAKTSTIRFNIVAIARWIESKSSFEEATS